MLKFLPIALSGFIGGIAPSMAELVSLCKQGNVPHFSFYLGAAIMGGMGAAVVLIAKETVPWKAFTQGMGTPALFSSATTAVTSVALMALMPIAYAQPPDTFPDTFPDTQDSVVVIVCQEPHGTIVFAPYARKEIAGSTIILVGPDSMYVPYIVPDQDTVKLLLKIYDPAIRRTLVQGLFPMQQTLTEKFEKKLTIEEIP